MGKCQEDWKYICKQRFLSYVSSTIKPNLEGTIANIGGRVYN